MQIKIRSSTTSRPPPPRNGCSHLPVWKIVSTYLPGQLGLKVMDKHFALSILIVISLLFPQLREQLVLHARQPRTTRVETADRLATGNTRVFRCRNTQKAKRWL
jgi:hypothetical protein